MKTSPQGRKTRAEILRRATDIASVEGLEGLTIGRLADALAMSKSGLFAHFGSKEDLQLAVVDAAKERFVEEIVTPCISLPQGKQRLLAYLSAWISYVEREVFAGGCFFAAAALELDGRPGPVRDQVAELSVTWLQMLRQEIRAAQDQGELKETTDVAQLAFELHAFVQEANWARQLLRDPHAFDHARTAVQNRLLLEE